MKLHGFMNKGIRHQCERCFIKYKIFQEKKKKKAFGSWVIVVCFVDGKQNLGQE